MKKPKLYSIGNNEKYNYYILENKKGDFHELIRNINNIFQTKITSNNKNSKKDSHLKSISKKNKINVFTGNKKIFLSILCEKKLRREFNDYLFKKYEMQNPKITLIQKIKDIIKSR